MGGKKNLNRKRSFLRKRSWKTALDPAGKDEKRLS